MPDGGANLIFGELECEEFDDDIAKCMRLVRD